MKRYHVIINGRVQGVGFRYQAQLNARERDLTGWVRNKMNGAVELEVQGEQNNIDAFLTSLNNLRFPAKVEDISKTEIDIDSHDSDFSVRS